MTTKMRFGLPGGRGSLAPGSAISTIGLAQTAEALGFDAMWFSEEHFSAVGNAVRRRSPSPLMLASAIAANTTRIRIGFTVLLPQLHDAIRLAEDIATLDILSGGRVNLGLGWPNALYLKAFGREDAHLSLPDHLVAMLSHWAGDPIDIGAVARVVEPPPFNAPHPPIYIAAHDDETISWAAQSGHALIASAFQSGASLRAAFDLYSGAGGHVVDSPIERFCFIADSNAAARRDAWPLVVALTERFQKTGTEQMANRIVDQTDFDAERFYNETAIIGDAETVAGKIAALRDKYGTGCINLRPSFWGSCSPELQRLTVERFAADVMPRFT
jgi:alkanesulfonate monooxygenase SsuD/methylene tetrahydromethanopterin reductase-like flavin-dependent oxidoreductase (luciferase family)